MGLEPVATDATLDNKWNGELRGILHLLLDDALYALLLGSNQVDDDFVVYLQYKFRADTLLLKALCHADHRNLHDIGCATLNRCIYGISLRKVACIYISGVDVGKVTATAK